MIVVVILLLQYFIFNSIFEDIDDQISSIKTKVFHSPTTVTTASKDAVILHFPVSLQFVE